MAVALSACSTHPPPAEDPPPAVPRPTTTALKDREDAHVVELIAPVGLRATYGLKDGDAVEIELT